MAAVDWDSLRKQFPAVQEQVYLNCASYGPGPRSVAEATHRAIDDWSEGRADWKDWERLADRARARFARLLGGDPEAVGLLPTVSLAVSQVARGLSFAAGENVVVGDWEFRSNLYPWLGLEREGVEVRAVKSAGGDFTTDLLQAIDRQTRVVAFSSVHSANGHLTSIEAVARKARASSARVLVDATQHVGALRFPLELVDYVVVSGYKWLLAPRGTSFLYVRPDLIQELEPLAPGWKTPPDPYKNYYGGPLEISTSAARFDQSLSWPAWVGAEAALALLEEIGIESIEKRNLELAGVFRKEMGLAPGGSQIVGLELERPDLAGEALARAGIVAALRDRFLRLGFHFFNNEEDVARAVAALSAFRGK